MEFIGMKFIMSRLLDNPLMAKLKLSSAAAYVKDFSSINNIIPILDTDYVYVKVEDYRAPLPAQVGDLLDVYICNTRLHPALTGDDRMSASMKTSKIPNENKAVYGEYNKRGSFINTDIENAVLELHFSCLRVDEQGYPTLPYDGSLVEAVTNYIKFRYFTILWENDMISKQKVDSAHSEYAWYLGQYTMKNTIPTYDEAVSWANSWQRLLDDKDLNMGGKSHPQHLNM